MVKCGNEISALLTTRHIPNFNYYLPSLTNFECNVFIRNELSQGLVIELLKVKPIYDVKKYSSRLVSLSISRLNINSILYLHDTNYT